MNRQEKSFILLLLLAISIALFVLTLYVGYQQNNERIRERVEMLSSSFVLTVNNVVSDFALDYIQWPPLLHALVDENYDFANEFFERAVSEKKYIESIELVTVSGTSSEEPGYTIQTIDNQITVYINLYNGEDMKFIDGLLLKVEIEEDHILSDLEHLKGNFYFIDNGDYDFAYDLQLSYSGTHLSVMDVLTALIVGVGSTIILWYLYNLVFSFQMKTSGLERIMILLERRDGYTIDHSRNVAVIASYIAKKLGISRRNIVKIEAAAKLHDIGKIAIPTEILEKSGELALGEYEQMKNHPVNGVEIIKQFKGLSDLAPGILYHHERNDGSGYPEGLMGDQIPIMAQIIAAADVFESLIADRPYRKGIGVEKTIKIMKTMPLNKAFIEILELNQTRILNVILNNKVNNKNDKITSIIEEDYN